MRRSRALAALFAAAALTAACASKQNRPLTTVPGTAGSGTPSMLVGASATAVSSPAVAQPPASRGTPRPDVSFPAVSGGTAAATIPAAAATTSAPAETTPAAAAATTAPAPQPAASSPSSSQQSAVATQPPASQPAASAPASAPSNGSAASAQSAPAATAGAPQSAPTVATAPQPTPTQAAPVATAQPAARPASPNDLIDAVKLQASDLPAGDAIGGLASTQANEQATSGYADPQSVLQRMNDTGRVIGYVQQINTPESPNGAGVSIEVWSTAAGAQSYFVDYPRPDASVQYQEITLPSPLGDQSFAYQFTTGGRSGYSIAWRRGRLILGVGEVTPDPSGLDKLLQLARILDQKAQASSQ